MSFLCSTLASSSRTSARSLAPVLSRGAKTGRGKTTTDRVDKVKKPGQGPPPDMPGDNATDNLKKELYPTIRPDLKSSAPYSIPRPDRLTKLPLVLPSEPAHETIQRASLAYTLDLERSRIEVLHIKNKRIFQAVEELRLTDKALYDLATVKDEGTGGTTIPVLQGKEKVESFFPREMRLPTESPGKTGWNYEWKFVPEEKALAKISFKEVKSEEQAKAEGEGEEVKA